MATALVGALIGAIGAEAVVNGRNDGMVAYALTALFGVLATMVLLIIPEAIGRNRARDGRRRSRYRLHRPGVLVGAVHAGGGPWCCGVSGLRGPEGAREVGPAGSATSSAGRIYEPACRVRRFAQTRG